MLLHFKWNSYALKKFVFQIQIKWNRKLLFVNFHSKNWFSKKKEKEKDNYENLCR